MKTLKAAFTLFAFLILTLTANAQTFYVSSSASASGQLIESAEIGMYLHTSEHLNISAGMGYAARFNHSENFTFGSTAEVLPEIKIAKLQPMLGLSIRGAIGEGAEAGSVSRKDLTGGFGYSAFIGADLGPVAVGSTLEQWVGNMDQIFVNPLTVRYRF